MQSRGLVQVVVVARRMESIYFQPSRAGDAHWVTRAAARELIEGGLCRLAPAPAKEPPQVAPQVAPEPAPQPERKPLRASDDAPVDRFAVIERAWEGRTVVCIASGPSTTREMIERIRVARERDRARVVVVNDMYLVCPWADVLFFADSKWWQWHRNGLAKSWPWVKFSAEDVRKRFAEFAGQKVTVFSTGRSVVDGQVFMLHYDGHDGLSEKSNELRTGGNSGHMALNLAALTGASQILLVGYDAKRGARGEKHGFGEHPDKTEPPYDNMRRNAASTVPVLKARGVEVLNCTPGSAIGCFPKMPLEQALV